MDLSLSEEQIMLRETARRWAANELAPIAEQVDEEDEMPLRLFQSAGAVGLMGIAIDPEYGGSGLDVLSEVIAAEEISAISPGMGLSLGASSNLCAGNIQRNGNAQQKARYLPDLVAGKTIGALGLTEPNAGSDAMSIATRATRQGDHYVLNGSKQWITNGGHAGIYTVIAITDRTKGPRGASAFIVEADDEGFSVGKKESKLGIRASATAELIFNDCRIPADRLLSREGMGFVAAMRTFDLSRPGVGAQGVGVAQGALDEAAAFARTRRQFDKPIITFQAVAHMLADMATKVEAARALVYCVARHIDSGAKDISKVSAMAKVFPTDVAMEVTTNAVQVMGGHGYMREYPVEKMMRDAKILQIYEGTNQIQRNVIGQELNKEYGRGK